MLRRLATPDWQSLRRRLCAGVTLLAYVVAAIGFPVPEASAQSPHACGQQVCCCGNSEQCKASGCGCSHEAPPEPEPELAAGDCCSKKKSKSEPSSRVKKPESTEAPSTPKNSKFRWVVSISAQKCRGGATQWLSADAALPMAPPVTWQPSFPFCHSLPITHEYPFASADDLLDPPPRLETV